MYMYILHTCTTLHTCTRKHAYMYNTTSTCTYYIHVQNNNTIILTVAFLVTNLEHHLAILTSRKIQTNEAL